MRKHSVLLGISSFAGLCLLAGCGIGTMSTSGSGPEASAAITGRLMGGQSPVAGARVFVFQANNTGYGQSSVDLIGVRRNSSMSIADPIALDTNYGAYYVTTNANGNFSVTNDYLCSGTGPVYLLATQGNPGLGTGQNNPALAMLAVIADACPSGGTLSSSLVVNIDEISTVASGYALSGYMTAPNKVSSNGAASALSLTGITNAADTALSLTNLGTGLPLATTAAGGTVPVSKLNELADMLASCINSTGTTSSGSFCGTLFSNATSTGTSAGIQPGETVTALLNIAKHPTANIANLTSLATSTAPFQPTLASTPTDLTLSVAFPPSVTIISGGTTYTGVTQNPNLLSVDSAGRVVEPGEAYTYFFSLIDAGGSLVVRSPLGAVQVSSLLLDGSGNPVYQPQQVAIDANGFGWLANGSNGPNNTNTAGQLLKANLTTGATTAYTSTNFQGPSNCIAVNGATTDSYSGSVTVCDSKSQGGAIDVFSNAGQYTKQQGLGVPPTGIAFSGNSAAGITVGINYLPYNLNSGTGTDYVGNPTLSMIAFGASGEILATGVNGSSSVVTFPTSFSLFSGGGLAFNTSAEPLVQIAMDGASSAWVPNYAGQSISEFSSAGTAITPPASGSFSGGFQTGCPSKGIAVDGAGNVWVSCNTGTSSTGMALVEFIGAATPVATPILPGQLGMRP